MTLRTSELSLSIFHNCKHWATSKRFVSFATIVKQSTSACTSEKFTQTDSTITGLPCTPSKISISTLTDDKICKVTRPPKKKKVKRAPIQSNENAHVCQNAANIESTPEKILSSNSTPQLSDISTGDSTDSTDDYIDYDPEESIEDIAQNSKSQHPTTISENPHRWSFKTIKT
ncbi:unnamed protein product [Larinioides sclopetarius]|uniref:Uncharacterized protein n=1 Tax=Larinioides sclopetarius TaxID=280406 RepID=A0AAV2AF96_9ARAC